MKSVFEVAMIYKNKNLPIKWDDGLYGVLELQEDGSYEFKVIKINNKEIANEKS